MSKISREQAKRIILKATGLHTVNAFGKGINATDRLIHQLGYIQVDTISVVQRAHHHILNTRNQTYQKDHLLKLQVDRRSIFEYWSHAAAYLPMAGYRFRLPQMEYYRTHQDGWPKADPKTKEYVFDRIRSEGPLMSKDFQKHEKSNNGWWDWKPAKVALQRLFFEGKIMIHHRRNFQRVYDISERILPTTISTQYPNDQDLAEYLVMTAIQSKGIIRSKDAHYLLGRFRNIVNKWIRSAIMDSKIIEIQIQGLTGKFYTTLHQLESIPGRIVKRIYLLSPFDNVVIQRERLKEFFDFDYQIECYVPKPKRKIGYYTLPILYGTSFVGYVDCKADRKRKVLTVNNLLLTSKIRDGQFVDQLNLAIEDIMIRNQCTSWVQSLQSVHKLPDAEYIA